MIHKYINFIYWRIWDIRRLFCAYYSLALIHLQMRLPYRSAPHDLSQELVVSLTSYRKRFPTLHLTLECLLRQSVQPDRIIVWLNEPDFVVLTAKLRGYVERGIEFRLTAMQVRSANKILPALKAFPDSIIITVDDDMYYQARMISDLVTGWSGDAKEIVCRYANRIPADGHGSFKRFVDWQLIFSNVEPSIDIIPFGYAGVLYPPNSLPPEALDEAGYLRLTPKADDIWLFWMGRRNGCRYRVVSGLDKSPAWPGSQETALKTENLFGGNQIYIDNMVAEFGWPL